MESFKDLKLKEHEKLRAELQALKQCQLQYFWSSVTVTGLILGLGSGFKELPNDDPAIRAFFFFAPLLIILPCWIVFFDKATTISRIVGYYRILEFQILHPDRKAFKYVGWENALTLFRLAQTHGTENDGTTKSKSRFRRVVRCVIGFARIRVLRFWHFSIDSVKGVFVLLDFDSTHRYWNLTWLSFFLLAVLCCCLGWTFRPKDTNTTPLLIVTLVSSFFTLAVSVQTSSTFYRLVKGKLSYDKNEELWKQVLREININSYCDKYCGTDGLGSNALNQTVPGAPLNDIK